MIRTIRLSITLFAAVLSAFGAARAGDAAAPSVQGAAVAPAARDELARTIDEMRKDVHELRREVHTLRQVLQNRADGSTPAERAMFSDLVEEYNKLVKQDRWAEAEVIAKRAKGLGRPKVEGMSITARATIMYEKARIGRQVARNADLKTVETPTPPECTITELDAATRLQVARIHFFPTGWVHGRVENEMELLKLAKASRDWSKACTLKKQDGSRQFVAACQRIIETLPTSSYAQLARDELRLAADDRQPADRAAVAGAPSAAEQSIRTALKKPVSVVIDNASLNQFASAIQKQGGFNIVIDKAGLDEVGKHLKGPYSISVRDSTLAGALKRVLVPLGLDYTVANDVLLISSPSRCNGNMETRCYPVADLVTDGKSAAGAKVDFEPLTKLITGIVEPRSWEGRGGRGQVQPDVATLSLIIRQSPSAHQQTRALLERLRSMNGGVSLTTTVIDRPTAQLLAGAGIHANVAEKAIIPLDDEQVRTIVETARASADTKPQQVRLLLPFGALASLPLKKADGSRREAIRLESTISDDRKRVGLSVEARDYGIAQPTRASVAASIPDHQTMLIVLPRNQAAGGTAAAAGPTFVIVRPDIPSEEEELLAEPVRLR